MSRIDQALRRAALSPTPTLRTGSYGERLERPASQNGNASAASLEDYAPEQTVTASVGEVPAPALSAPSAVGVRPRQSTTAARQIDRPDAPAIAPETNRTSPRSVRRGMGDDTWSAQLRDEIDRVKRTVGGVTSHRRRRS